jgi:Uroporphyrinogen decarboxylase (URO-D)
MTGRERIRCALNHQQPDRVPIDFGATVVTGIAASMVAQLKEHLGLGTSSTPVKVSEPCQFLGEVDEELRAALGTDAVMLPGPTNAFGFKNEGWKPWTFFDGTKLFVPELFNTIPNENGDILQYPKGDTSVPASARMPKGGYYFDAIVRQKPIDESQLNSDDNVEEYSVFSEDVLRYFEEQSERLYNDTDLAIVGSAGGTALGNIAHIPGMSLKDPKGIRDIEEWYVSIMIRKDYVKEVFEKQSEIVLENLKLYHQAVGNKIDVIYMSGTDFGTQNGPFISNELYRELYLPYQKRLNDWVHANTDWKTFMHCCGGVGPLIPEFIEAGFDILNPVQVSAAGMDPKKLKEKYGDKLVFWGGGVDTQQTLPFGTPDEVYEQTRERIEIFSKGGGFVFNTIHNIQALTPIENLMAMFKALSGYAG